MYKETLTINGKVKFTVMHSGKIAENQKRKITPYCVQHGQGKKYFVLPSLGNEIVCDKDDVIIRELKNVVSHKDGE